VGGVGRVSRDGVEALLVFHPRGDRRGAARWRGGLVAVVASLLLGLSASATLAAGPNDPFFARQWGDSNTGQPIPTQGSNEVLGGEVAGTLGADEHALAAWGVTTGSRSIVIGETDTGVDYTHPDLAANIWSNPGGINGCAAGTHGYNVLTKACDPMDEETLASGGYGGHGTHVAGILGAVPNNGVGVAGLNWQTSILPVKWLQTANSANETEHLVEALKWLVKAQEAGVNVRVVNDSPTFKASGPSPELEHEIKVLGEHQILFVTSAGNDASNDDEASVLRYPCKYRLPNEICVTASNNEDKLPSWANTGRESVNLAAPGASIYSTIRGGEYRYLSGGSMAAAQVSGAAALILAARPSLSVGELKAAILDNVDALPALAGKVATGGRLDIAKALPALVSEVSPGSGPAGGGTQVTITGANLARATGVAFGSAAAAFTVNSPTSITATAPPGSGTVEVTVTTPAGSSAATQADRFTYSSESSPSEPPSEPPPSEPPPSEPPPSEPPPEPPPPVVPGEPPPSPPRTPATSPSQGTTTTSQTTLPGVTLTLTQTTTSGGGAVLGITNATSALALVRSTLAVRHGRAAVGLRCTGPRDCRGRMTLAVELTTRKDSEIVRVRWLTIGHVAFDVGAAHTATVLVTLTTVGVDRLSVGHGSLGAILAIVSSPQTHMGVRSKHVRLQSSIAGVKSAGA
jgi:subtilisin family serine protease